MERIPSHSREALNKSEIEKHDEIVALKYLKNLDLSEADIIGRKTLDIGAGEGEFARWANSHGGDVTSIGLHLVPEHSLADTRYTVGTAVSLPFADSAFDLVVSHAAIPNVVGITPNEHIPRDSIKKRSHERRMNAVFEAVRVLKPGGEIRFAPVVRNERNAHGPDRNASMEQMLAALKSDDSLDFREELLEKDHKSYGNAVSDEYRLVIRKRE